ncbi:MAG: nucleoid-associated protein [Bacteroidetes bacterium]|nr:nucleoid-associated protein [Bacteroidota bacterium]
MIDLSSAALKSVSVHFVGNKSVGDELIHSKKPMELEDREKKILANAFLGRFKLETNLYAFTHGASLDYNEVYNYCLETLAEPDELHKNAVNITKHLYESATHPKIKAGDVYICLFENCVVNSAYVDAIGIYKAESKTDFLDLNIEDKEFELTLRQGVDISKVDKACLVLSTNGEKGFDVLIYDTNGKGEEAVYWRETFLNIAPQANEYYQTNEFLTIAKQFIAKQVPQEFEIEKTEQIDMLNKSVEYFRANTSFDKKQFEETVMGDESMIRSFRKFEDAYREDHDIDLPDRFDISAQAVKKQARVFKSVLKLDRNFHIYIHGDKDLIEKGYDPVSGKHFYKIYFDEEE